MIYGIVVLFTWPFEIMCLDWTISVHVAWDLSHRQVEDGKLLLQFYGLPKQLLNRYSEGWFV